MDIDSFWGKLNRLDAGSITHPLIAHCADVSAVLETLLTIPVINHRLSTTAQHLLDETLVQRLAAISALHDLGKFSIGFQAKIDENERGTCGHIEVLTGLLGCQQSNNFSRLLHLLEPMLKWTGPSGESLREALNAVFSHHGTDVDPFRENPASHKMASHWQPNGDIDPMKGVETLFRLIPQWFPAAFSDKHGPLPDTTHFYHLFAGFVTLADWIASDTSLFPFCGQDGRPPASVDPMPFAREKSREALAAIGMDTRTVRHVSGKLPELKNHFHYIHNFVPNSVQLAMDKLPSDTQGSLVILEAETGSGKTEAAMRHFSRLFWQGRVDGVYFANPLRLAATQLHKRMVNFVSRTFTDNPPPTVLAVPGYLRVDDAEGYRLPEYRVMWNDNQSGPLSYRGWACENPKRFLCAPVAVGTIDQAMLASLKVPHAHLRASSLSRSLLVVDEVHASDPYMTAIIENLVRLFSKAGGHLLLMSATLATHTKERYQSTWHERPYVQPPSPVECSSQPYPLITTHKECITPVAESGNIITPKTVDVTLSTAMRSPGRIAELAAGFAMQGACVLVLRNTVKPAVEVQLRLRELLADQPRLLFSVNNVPALHHGRFAREDRRLLDNEVTRRFGKRHNMNSQRPPCVLVSTQTIEQSLDVDFDVIITDLCPMDVLLQRIGRLHRHPNLRPADFLQARCIILVPDALLPDWLLSRTAGQHGFGENRAYPNLLAVEATRRRIAELEAAGKPLVIPKMNRQLVEGALHPEILKQLAGELSPQWAQSHREHDGTVIAQSMLGAGHCIDWNKPFSQTGIVSSLDENITTRLGLRDRQIELTEPISGPFSSQVRTLKIPAWMTGEQHTNEDSVTAQQTGNGSFTFTFTGKTLFYNENGLQHQEE